MKYSILLHFIGPTILKKNYNLTPLDLDMYNGLSQVYDIKQEGRIH